MVQLVDAFDVLLERAKAVEETLIEPPRSITTEIGKRGSDRSSGRPGKRGREFRRFGKNDQWDSRLT